ncbi:MAG TPA: FAD-dependent monooxygenase [Candidatus Angelobacter sp.]|nr:FAD-dependent monooxygenase [Candidatus Angelobacter sp.]
MSRAFDTDVFVIGGGPAGLAAAIAARQHGLRVMVADHDEPPIDKACGEGLMPDSLEVLAQLGVKLDPQDVGTFRGIKFLGPQDSVAAEFPRGTGLGIRRLRLHQILVDYARALGIEMLWRARVSLNNEADTESESMLVVNSSRVRSRWLVGADGQNSRVRQWAGLLSGRVRARRFALRRHFRVLPWSEYVEIYWGRDCQAYVTPIAKDQLCVALISRRRLRSFEDGLAGFPELAERLRRAEAISGVRGAMSISQRLDQVWRGRVALVGEASGSVDAITGEGLAMAFRQALALAPALAAGDLASYAAAHRSISSLPEFMARSMLLMDSSPLIRRRTLRALSRRPALFARMLAVHVGELPIKSFAAHGLLDLGWQMVVASVSRAHTILSPGTKLRI